MTVRHPAVDPGYPTANISGYNKWIYYASSSRLLAFCGLNGNLWFGGFLSNAVRKRGRRLVLTITRLLGPGGIFWARAAADMTPVFIANAWINFEGFRS